MTKNVLNEFNKCFLSGFGDVGVVTHGDSQNVVVFDPVRKLVRQRDRFAGLTTAIRFRKTIRKILNGEKVKLSTLAQVVMGLREE